MTKQLPPQPSLEHLSNQAKDLLKAHRKGDASICARLKTLHRFSGSTESEILAAEVTLAEAQFVLAMEYGFKTWTELKEHVEGTDVKKAFTSIEDLGAMSNRGFQFVIREMEFKNLVLAMMDMPRQIYGRFWKNMSSRTRDSIQDDWGAMGPVDPGVVASARESMLRIANGLAERKEDIYKGGEEKVPDWEKELVKSLKDNPAGSRKAAELVPLFVELTRAARREGLVALEGITGEHVDDELLKLGLRMTIDGINPQQIREILDAKKATLLLAHERRLGMIIAAVEGIGAGLNPSLMEEKCRAFLG